jgi:hypothetical protein
MSNQENVKKTIDSAKNMAGNLISSILSLKEKQPKVFFGALGGIVALLILMMISGGDEPTPVSGPTVKNLVAGQRYVLKAPNTYDPKATVRLVPVPGTLAAYDDTEEADRTSPCQHMPQGTPVSVLDFQDAYGKKNVFVKVQIEEGECKGNSGWTLAINIQ